MRSVHFVNSIVLVIILCASVFADEADIQNAADIKSLDDVLTRLRLSTSTKKIEVAVISVLFQGSKQEAPPVYIAIAEETAPVRRVRIFRPNVPSLDGPQLEDKPKLIGEGIVEGDDLVWRDHISKLIVRYPLGAAQNHLVFDVNGRWLSDFIERFRERLEIEVQNDDHSFVILKSTDLVPFGTDCSGIIKIWIDLKLNQVSTVRFALRPSGINDIRKNDPVIIDVGFPADPEKYIAENKSWAQSGSPKIDDYRCYVAHITHRDTVGGDSSATADLAQVDGAIDKRVGK